MIKRSLVNTIGLTMLYVPIVALVLLFGIVMLTDLGWWRALLALAMLLYIVVTVKLITYSGP